MKKRFANQLISRQQTLFRVIIARFTELERAVKELKQADHSTAILASIRSQVPSVVKEYLGSSLPDAFQTVLQSHTKELKKERYEKRDYKGSKFYYMSKGRALEQDSTLFRVANMEKGDKPDIVLKKRDRGDDQYEDPSAGSNEVLDPGWNTVKTVDDTPEQPWFNEVIQAEKPPLTFDDLMSTPIDFLAYAMNRLKLNEITLFGICNELEYNMEECYRYFTDQLDWANPEGHKSTVDMSKPLPLQDKEGRLVIPV
ncbi:hypothetical protein Tco_1506765 [Tanacetum coccineum]